MKFKIEFFSHSTCPPQAQAVADAYTRQGMPQPERRDSGEWSGLFWV